jgi:predicted nucleic acid-binding protein
VHAGARKLVVDQIIRSTAAAYPKPKLRSLDAIHLALLKTAAFTASLTALVTYDTRLRQGLTPCVAPTCDGVS